MAKPNGTTFEPHLAFRGVWDFTTPIVYARVEGGFRISDPGGLTFGVLGTYGGLFAPDQRNWSVRANLTIPFH